ncbi:disulfide bond formation protein B [Rhodovulum sp. FJ3]|uniref:disulfide bond formation protein B n=1 Tax=Rhodovulum sp. FJ3 TaxID=3079053 RepID=UPI00293DBB93|nr:disulfide bond formation protein B [Rhodovulum sp. FJ3]MDV4168062.1 disulfide bond formation protein B [Rhodovulum sp. FJ3]
MTDTRRFLILLAAAGSLSMLLGAWAFQFIGGLAPCAMCIWQRWPHGAAVLAGLIGMAFPARIIAALGAVSAATTSGIGIYHTGVERDWWQGPTSCTSAGGGLSGMSGADLLNFEAAPKLVLCDEVAWSLFGLSMASWNALFSALFVLIWLRALTRPS